MLFRSDDYSQDDESNNNNNDNNNNINNDNNNNKNNNNYYNNNKNQIEEIDIVEDKNDGINNANTKINSVNSNNNNNNKGKEKNIHNSTIEKTAITTPNPPNVNNERKPKTYIGKTRKKYLSNEIKEEANENEDGDEKEKDNNINTKISPGKTVGNTIIINNFNIIQDYKQYYDGTLVGSSNPEINIFSQYSLGYHSKYATKIDNKFNVHESNNQHVCDNDLQGIINNQNLN